MSLTPQVWRAYALSAASWAGVSAAGSGSGKQLAAVQGTQHWTVRYGEDSCRYTVGAQQPALDPKRSLYVVSLSISFEIQSGGGIMRLFQGAAVCLLLTWHAHAHEGFVLKAGEGESVMNGIVIKISPQNASTQAILAEQTFPRCGSTGLHIHEQGDELFYVVSGRGTASLAGDTEVIERGDVIFVPDGTVHGVANPDGEDPLVVIFFMDSPELAEQFRAVHERLVADPETPMTAAEWDELSRSYGGMRIAE